MLEKREDLVYKWRELYSMQDLASADCASTGDQGEEEGREHLLEPPTPEWSVEELWDQLKTSYKEKLLVQEVSRQPLKTSRKTSRILWYFGSSNVELSELFLFLFLVCRSMNSISGFPNPCHDSFSNFSERSIPHHVIPLPPSSSSEWWRLDHVTPLPPYSSSKGWRLDPVIPLPPYSSSEGWRRDHVIPLPPYSSSEGWRRDHVIPLPPYSSSEGWRLDHVIPLPPYSSSERWRLDHVIPLPPYSSSEGWRRDHVIPLPPYSSSEGWRRDHVIPLLPSSSGASCTLKSCSACLSSLPSTLVPQNSLRRESTSESLHESQ